MAKRSFALSGWTPVGVLNTANFTDNGYCALKGGSATQRTKVLDIFMGGLATASAPCPMVFAYDSTVGVTLTALTTGQADGPLDPATAALAAPPVPFTASTTKPQRSATLPGLMLAFNAFGGLVRYNAAQDQEPVILGNTAALLGEMSLSAYTGGTPGLLSSHIIYETL